jgi:flagellin
MPQTINTNLTSLNAQRNLNSSQMSLSVAMQRLSSGLRVNSAKDDAAGPGDRRAHEHPGARHERWPSATPTTASRWPRWPKGALSKVGDALQRMRELALQARNATNSDSDKDSLNKEFAELQKEISRVLGGTSFNGKHILGADATSFTFQVGANTTADDVVEIDFENLISNADITAVTVTTATIGSTADATSIASVIDNIDTALDTVNNTRATFGATQSRFEAIIGNLQVAVENQSAARSRIMDADFAAETANLSRAQILQQAGNAMVAQANQLPQQVLKLLG